MGHARADFGKMGILTDQQEIGLCELRQNDTDNTQDDAIGQRTSPDLSRFGKAPRSPQVAGLYDSPEHQSDAADQQQHEG